MWSSGVDKWNRKRLIQIKIVESFNTSNNILVNINFLAQYAVSIDNDSPNSSAIKILSCYPNPFNASILFKYKIGNVIMSDWVFTIFLGKK